MPKLQLIHVLGRSSFCSGRLSIGVYILRSGAAVLIDSGIDKDSAKDADKALQDAGYSVAAIINTHHHPDHCGGNAYFQKQYPAVRVFASQFERIFIENPFMQPLCFCAGAAPFAELRNKYLEAPASVVTDVIADYRDQVIEIEGEAVTIVTLPGHTAGSIGVITPDNVLYCGDAMLGEEAFNKHGMMLYTNIADSLASFKKLAAMQVSNMVFYHGGATQAIAEAAQHHEQRILETKNLVLGIIGEKIEGISIDELTQAIMQRRVIPDNVMQFTLTRTTVNAYVSQLCSEGKAALAVADGLLRARKV